MTKLNYNPVPALLESGNEAISVFTKRDLLNNPVSFEDLWQLPESRRILRKQKPDGSWLYPGGNKDIRTQENYNQLETYRNVGVLVEEFGFSKNHPAIRKAADYLFTFQTLEGDFIPLCRGMFNQNV